MTLETRVTEAIKDAMRAKDSVRLDALRALRGEIVKYHSIGKGGVLSDDEVMRMARTLIKQRQDSAAMFHQGGRPAQAAKELAEIEVLREFLPPALTEAELDALVAQAIAGTGAAGPGDMGKVMHALKPLIAATGKEADARLLTARVKATLAG